MKQNGEKKKKRTKWQYVLLFSIIILIVISIPFIINEAYKMGGYKTVWSGADAFVFYGSILEAVGTITLGALALRQNYIFKEENERVQERLEKINAHANEINIINKIVEYETNHINKINKYSEEFIEVSVPLKYTNSTNSFDKSDLSKEFFFGTKTENVYYRIIPLLTESVFYNKNIDDFINSFTELFADSLALHAYLKSDLASVPEDLLKKCKESLRKFKIAKEMYIIEGNRVIKDILLGDYTLEQLHELSKEKEKKNERIR